MISTINSIRSCGKIICEKNDVIFWSMTKFHMIGRVWGFQHQEMSWEGYSGEVLNPLWPVPHRATGNFCNRTCESAHPDMAEHKAIYCELWWLDIFGWASLLLKDTICGLYVSCAYHKMKWNLICIFTVNKILLLQRCLTYLHKEVGILCVWSFTKLDLEIQIDVII